MTREPRHFGVVSLVLVFVLGLGSGAAVVALVLAPPTATAEKEVQRFHCPMHPTIVQDHPGNCPICGMKLIPIPSAAKTDHVADAPTHAGHGTPADAHAAHGAGGSAGAQVAGLTTVTIDPQRQQLIGLRTAVVERGPVGGAWRTNGRVVVDETRVRRTNLKVGGFVERVYVDFVGKAVRKGDPLFSLYSPDLVSAQHEYLLALKTRTALGTSGSTGSVGDDLVASSRRRLELWDVPASMLAELERTGSPQRTLTIHSPIAGVVTVKSVVEGASLEPGAMPYEIVDLSKVWAVADVFEAELRRVKLGMPAQLTLEAYPGQTFDGKVIFIDPVLDRQSRTAKVRLELDNRAGLLKPELFGEVTLSAPSTDVLRVPTDALIPTGTSHVVFVDLGEGKLEPRRVGLGNRDADFAEIKSGVSEGERVVSRAGFLVDSESRLRASLAAMESAPAGPSPTPEPKP